MKNTTVIILCFAIIVYLLCAAVLSNSESTTTPKEEEVNTIYEVSAIVEEVNKDEALVLFVDWNGEAWYYEMESENFSIGQLVIIEFDSMGTDNIYDDEIVKIRS